MKPILFSASETAFTSNGLGRLDPIKCVVVEERNGQYELECVVPVDSPHYEDIANNMILGVIPGDGMTLQAFRIYQITEPLNGLVTLSARHLSYDLSYNSVMPFTASSINAAFLGLVTNSVETNPFTMWTDKTTAANFKVTVPQTFRSLLGGQQGSILDIYGGEYEFDNWTVRLWNHRGSDTNVTLRYGKNITDINQEQNLESVVTGLVPYWASDNDLVTLPEKSVDSSYASLYPYKRTVPIDFSNEYEGPPTAAQLRAKAESYILANDIGLPKVSIKVSFVALWQTEEYKNVAPLERVHLCDTVGVVFEKYGINARAKVIRTEWDCLAERYLSIDLGEARSNFAKTVVGMNDETHTEIEDAKTFLEKAIDTATSIITGTNGGYLKINANSDGQPYELLIMDTDDIETATKVWRWNMGGLGYSSTGYSGTFGTAITMDGQIVANYIATGELDAARIKAGILTDLAGKFSLNMTTGALSMADGTFSGTISGSTISGSTITSSKTVGGVTKTTKIEDGTITTNDLQATSGTFTGTVSSGTISGGTVSGATITSSKTEGGVTKTTTIQDGTITTNNLQATGGKISSVSGSNKVEIQNGEIDISYNNTLLSRLYSALYSGNTVTYLRSAANTEDFLYVGPNGPGLVSHHGDSILFFDTMIQVIARRIDVGTGNGYAYTGLTGDYTLDGKNVKIVNGLVVSIT